MNWGWSLQRYQHSQKAALVGVVHSLCEKLVRPVCSDDLAREFRLHPEQRPLLKQRTGLMLAKAARIWSDGWPILHKVGVHKKRAYYAPDSDPLWKVLFDAHVMRMRLEWLLSLGMGETFCREYESSGDESIVLAVNGFRTELSLSQKHFLPEHLRDSVDATLQSLAHIPKVSYSPPKSGALIGRAQAIEILKRHATQWYGRSWASKKNYKRILCDWVWPISTLFPAAATVLHHGGQIDLLGGSLWNRSLRLRSIARKDLLISIYLPDHIRQSPKVSS